MSAMVPNQFQSCTQMQPEFSDSEQSEVLIPLIETPQRKKKIDDNTNKHDKVIERVEESQSILPQFPIQTKGVMKSSTEECLSSSSYSQTVLDFPMLSQINVKEDTSKNKLQAKHRAISGSNGKEYSQEQTSIMMEPNMLFSQVSLSNSMTGEINADMNFSQRETILSNTEKLSSKIENLVDSLDRVPRKQMLVTEATLLQCISYLQNNLHKQFKKNNDNNAHLGINKQLLQICQTGIVKVSKIHKNEKITMNQSEVGTQTKNKTIKAQALKDLGKRQKRVLVLLKRQRCLVDLLKTLKRSSTCDSDTMKTRYPVSNIETDNRVNYKPKATGKVMGKKATDDVLNKNAKMEDLSEEFDTTINKTGEHGLAPSEITNLQDDLRETGNGSPGRSSPMVHDTQDCVTQEVKTGTQLADAGLLLEFSQRNNTQNTIRTSGKDLFDDDDDDGDNDNVGNSTTGNSPLVTNSLSQMYECMESKNDEKNQTGLPMDDGTLTEAVQASLVNLNNVSTVSDGRNVDSGKLPKKDLNTSFNEKDDYPAREIYDNNEKIGMAFNLVDNVNGDNSVHKESSENVVNVGMRETSEINDADTNDDDDDDDDDENCVVHRNTDLNHLKRKVIETDLDLGKSRKVELQVKQNSDTENVSKSESLWLNMLRNDNDKMKPVQISTRKENAEPANKLDKSEILIAKKLPMINDGSSLQGKHLAQTISESVYDHIKFKTNRNFENKEVNRNGENARYQNEVIVDTSTRSQVSTVQDNMLRSIDEVNENFPSFKACSPVSLAVRGSPCDTLINISPNGSTVCSEGFTLPTEHLDSFRKPFQSSHNKPERSKSNYQTFEPNISKAVQLENIYKLCQAGEEENPISAGAVNGMMNDQTIKTYRENSDHIHWTAAEPDTISKAIDSVIQQSRVLNSTCQNNGEELEKKQKQSTITSLKELVHSGIVFPGKSVLSCNIKGIHHKASVTYSGKISTSDGKTYNTVSAWITSLDNSVVCKKRKAYEMVQYKGRSLLSYNQLNKDQPRVTQPYKVMKDSCTQVDTSVFTKQHRERTDDDLWLNNLLSKSIVRLLSNEDLVTNDDLPDNFWTEDFSTVRLSTDIWKSVTAW